MADCSNKLKPSVMYARCYGLILWKLIDHGLAFAPGIG